MNDYGFSMITSNGDTMKELSKNKNMYVVTALFCQNCSIEWPWEVIIRFVEDNMLCCPLCKAWLADVAGIEEVIDKVLMFE